MVEARRKAPAPKKAPANFGKKGKGKKKGMSEAEADALFERELAMAIAMSKEAAGLNDPPVVEQSMPEINVALEEAKHQQAEEDRERMAAQEEQMRNIDQMHIEYSEDCPVCMLLIVEPTQLPCKHVFCKGCAQASLNFRWECPMCRYLPPRTFNFPVSEEIQAEFRAKADPEQWEAREKQVAELAAMNKKKNPSPRHGHQQAQGQAQAAQQSSSSDDGDDVFQLEILYGNRHKLIDNAPLLKNGRRRNHEWTCYVQINTKSRTKPQDIFQSCMFTLPPCYSNRYREVLSAGAPAGSKHWFECKEVGWGQVNVQITLKFKDDLGFPLPDVKLQHMTSFRPQGHSQVAKIKIPKELARQLRLCQ